MVCGCRRTEAPTWQRTQHIEGLLTSTSWVRESPDDAPTSVLQMRPALVQPQVLGRQRVIITEAGEKSFAMLVSDLGIDMQSGEVELRDAQGKVTSRPIKLTYWNGRLTAVVDFGSSDVGNSYEMTLLVRAPWPPLHAQSHEFRVSAGAHLRFGAGFKVLEALDKPVEGRIRVTLEARGGSRAVLYESHLQLPPGTADLDWADADVDLSRFAGETVSLLFEATREPASSDADVELPIPLISEPFLVMRLPRQQRRNVVLVSIDTLRADHVGTYGYPRATSPLIDRLAATGATFTDAFAVWPETSASHMTLFTSLFPAVHGVSLMLNRMRPLPAWQVTLAEVLSSKGYVTSAITEDGLINWRLGFARGFSEYREFREPGVWVSGPGVADQVFATAERWLQQHRDDAFFLFLHTYQVHNRLAHGEAYDSLRAAFEKDGVSIGDGLNAPRVRDYDAAIRFTDDALAGVVRTLDELQLSERTLLIITSDHGEEFGTHGVLGHGYNLFDFEVHVPLVFRCPGLVPAGNRSATPVGLIDVAPTLLDLLQLPQMAQTQGHSFAKQVLGEPEPPPRPVFGELGKDLRSVRYPDYKVVWRADQNGGQADYYDLRRDPGEVAPGADGERVADAVALIREHDLEALALREQLAAAAGKPVAGTPVPIDAETLAHMRALGYEPAQQ
jgi:arylsulfatase A-like enzyme